jgi:hypothetical protein
MENAKFSEEWCRILQTHCRWDEAQAYQERKREAAVAASASAEQSPQQKHGNSNRGPRSHFQRHVYFISGYPRKTNNAL